MYYTLRHVLYTKTCMYYTYIKHVLYTRTLKISIKHFKGFSNVQKSIETSGDISVLWPITFLWARSPKSLAEWSWVHSIGFRTSDAQRNVMCGYWDATTCFYAFLDIPKFLEIFNGNFFNILFIYYLTYVGIHKWSNHGMNENRSTPLNIYGER